MNVSLIVLILFSTIILLQIVVMVWQECNFKQSCENFKKLQEQFKEMNAMCTYWRKKVQKEEKD